MTPEFLQALEHVSIDPWLGVDPQDLTLDPKLTANLDTRTAGARAVKYARADGATSYDDIGFRTFVAAPSKGHRPLQTMMSTRLQRQRNERHHADPLLEEMRSQQHQLRHRPLDLPRDEVAEYTYRLEGSILNVQRSFGKDGTTEVPWPFSLWNPPSALLGHAADMDVALIAAQRLAVELPGARWVPLGRLIEAGRFLRMQEWADDLVCDTTPEHYYCFVSHRWLTPTHPDPEGLQARFTAWQLVGYLCEAVHVAHQRGLRRPRRVNLPLNMPVGPAGTNFAEALLVNVLRFALRDDDLAQAAAEARELEPRLEDYGVAAALEDEGLHTLSSVLAVSPVIRRLVERIFVWYDYSCLPQPPRTDAEQALFRAGLNALNLCQILGHTVVLLDDAEDYLSRAWCTFEGVVADRMGQIDPLVGSHRTTVVGGRAEHYFHELLNDRPHLVWRAVLDTEVFRVQNEEQCMTRLGLAVSDLGDLPFIYERLRTLQGPTKIHVDQSELVTGVLPLPAVDGGAAALVVKTTGRQVDGESEHVEASLAWDGCLSLTQAWNASDAGALSSFMRLAAAASVVDQSTESRRLCHASIVASCEGEAVLMVRWLLDRCAELEGVLPVTIGSVSWLATDIAPVGHFVDCRLRAMVIDAPIWVVIAVRQRFKHCGVTARVTDALRHAQVTQFRVVIDEQKDNVLAITPKGTERDVGGAVHDKVKKIQVPASGFPVHAGGLFRAALDDHLL